MKILEKEIDLREETRTLEQARAALATDEYEEKALAQSETQGELAVRVADVVDKIMALPNADAFPKEIALLSAVNTVMQDAQEILSRPDTGPEAIAAETEAIELLLQARRVNPNGGGGGGSSPGGGGTGDTDQAALALIGMGAERNAGQVNRTVGQATGSAGGELPAEYRAGLDAFFQALEEGNRGGQ